MAGCSVFICRSGSCFGLVSRAMCGRGAPAAFTYLHSTCTLARKIKPASWKWESGDDSHKTTCDLISNDAVKPDAMTLITEGAEASNKPT